MSIQHDITVIGAGITGLWQAVTLARAGHGVTLFKQADTAAKPASWYAGGMLAPFCEGESAEPVVSALGQRSITLWRDVYPETQVKGSLVVAGARDLSELKRFDRMTENGTPVDGAQIAELEPDLEDRFRTGIHFAQEAHLSPRDAMAFLETHARALGVKVETVDAEEASASDGTRHSDKAASGWIIDCRGLAARNALSDLRGVRGEMAIIRSDEVNLSRPVRLLHPRFPLYIVPWGENRFMVGATVVEREDTGPATVRAGLELLGHAYTLHPGFAEAEIEDMAAGVRPAFPDNAPKIVVAGKRLYINGMYRHGFLTAPALAELVAKFIATGETHPEVFRADCGERNIAENGRPNAA